MSSNSAASSDLPASAVSSDSAALPASSDLPASAASTHPDTGSAKSDEPIKFLVDSGHNRVILYYADEGVIFEGIYCEKMVHVTYRSRPTNPREDNSGYNTVILLYDVCVEIHDPTNPSASFTADGILHCETYICCEDESIEDGTANYYASIKIRHPTTGKYLDIDYPRSIR
jgi:hypothetical protein